MMGLLDQQLESTESVNSLINLRSLQQSLCHLDEQVNFTLTATILCHLDKQVNSTLTATSIVSPG